MVMIDDGAGAEPSDQLLWGIKTVVAKTGLSRASIYRYIKRERFPPRRRVGPNRVAWVPAEVIAWVEARAIFGPGRR
jgi:prophage regulatory protein